MRISVVLPSGKRLNLEVEPNMLGEEIPEQLIENNMLQAESNSAAYGLAFKEKDHRQLEMGSTLEENGVEENDALMVTTSAVAG